jgi:outer membrane protein OmpA-like peptidoglycan-associated protein
MKRSTLWALLLAPLLGALPAAADPAAESAADRCVGKVRLRGAIYDYQDGTLQPGIAEVLDGLARTFRERCPEKLLIIEAHAYEMPTPELNQRLSELRAHTLRYELAKRGIPEPQTIPAGMGSTKPTVPVDSPDAMQENRRITFRVAD